MPSADNIITECRLCTMKIMLSPYYEKITVTTMFIYHAMMNIIDTTDTK